MSESLADSLRRATRNFTSRLPEDQVFSLGRDLAQELARAHAEKPPRHPELDPVRIELQEGKPRLSGSRVGSVASDLFELGSLLHCLATGQEPDVSWRLDGPPPPEIASLRRRPLLTALASPSRLASIASAEEAAKRLEEALQGEPDTEAPWPLFRGDPARAGARSGPPPGALSLHWQAAVGGVVASPVLTSSLVLAATADGRLLFLDRASGGLLAELRVATALESSPALLGRLLHLGTDDGELVGVDVPNGRETYRVKLGEVIRSSPLPADDRLLVGVVEGKAGAVAALEAGTGKTIWRRKLGAVFSSPALAPPFVIVGSDDASVHALDLAKGTVAWSRPMSERVRATPAVRGELAVVSDFHGRLAALQTKDGNVLWQRELGQPIYSSACFLGELGVVGCHDGRVYGFRLTTGEPVFQLETRGPVVSSPVAVGGRLLVASTDGSLYLLDDAGHELARLSVAPEGVQSSPALDATAVVLGSGRGLHAFRLLESAESPA